MSIQFNLQNSLKLFRLAIWMRKKYPWKHKIIVGYSFWAEWKENILIIIFTSHGKNKFSTFFADYFCSFNCINNGSEINMSMVLANVITYSEILKFIEFPSHLLVKLLHRIFILKNGKILKNSSQIQILHVALKTFTFSWGLIFENYRKKSTI